jgi:hypothetical protein
VEGGEIIYDPWLESPELIPYDYYELVDIGFGLYDTVFVKDLGDNPGAVNLFVQAYRNEVLGQYLQAINLYKSVITTYWNSPYAALSLPRIINCAEKKRSTLSEYSLFQNYFNTIRISTIYNREMRELAEDLVIKCKVRRGMLNEAISDYEAMHQQNQNNPKGRHALLNKLTLIAMRDSLGQNTLFGSNFNPPFTQGSESQVTREFKLYQNYPNPFNPATMIKYRIPTDGQVSLKIYDILGREVYSMNEFMTAGEHEFIFDGSNLASGLYYYRIESNGFVESKKMLLLK